MSQIKGYIPLVTHSPHPTADPSAGPKKTKYMHNQIFLSAVP